jgi:hypothetical protein
MADLIFPYTYSVSVQERPFLIVIPTHAGIQVPKVA